MIGWVVWRNDQMTLNENCQRRAKNIKMAKPKGRYIIMIRFAAAQIKFRGTADASHTISNQKKINEGIGKISAKREWKTDTFWKRKFFLLSWGKVHCQVHSRPGKKLCFSSIYMVTHKIKVGMKQHKNLVRSIIIIVSTMIANISGLSLHNAKKVRLSFVIISCPFKTTYSWYFIVISHSTSDRSNYVSKANIHIFSFLKISLEVGLHFDN